MPPPNISRTPMTICRPSTPARPMKKRATRSTRRPRRAARRLLDSAHQRRQQILHGAGLTQAPAQLVRQRRQQAFDSPQQSHRYAHVAAKDARIGQHARKPDTAEQLLELTDGVFLEMEASRHRVE